MLPEITVAVLAFDRLAREPLLPGNALEMAVAVRIQAMIAHEHRLDDRVMLPDGDHGEVFDVEIDGYRHQVGVLLALHHLPGFDLPDLGDMQLCRMRSQDQGWALPLPLGFRKALHQVARRADRVLHPAPVLPGVDVEAHKGLLEIERLQIQGDAPLIERGMIAGRWKTRLALPLV